MLRKSISYNEVHSKGPIPPPVLSSSSSIDKSSAYIQIHSLVTILLIGWFLFSFKHTQHHKFLPLMVLFAYVLALTFFLLVHELGHAVAGLLAGAKVRQIIVSEYGYSNSDFGSEFFRTRSGAIAGYVMPYASPNGNVAKQISASVLGGPVASLITFFVAVVWFGREWLTPFTILFFASGSALLASLSTLAGTLIPATTQGSRTDLLVWLKFRNHSSRAMMVSFYNIYRESLTGVRPKDWNEADVALILESAVDPVDKVSAFLIAHSFFLDRGDAEKAYRYLEEADKLTNEPKAKFGVSGDVIWLLRGAYLADRKNDILAAKAYLGRARSLSERVEWYRLFAEAAIASQVAKPSDAMDAVGKAEYAAWRARKRLGISSAPSIAATNRLRSRILSRSTELRDHLESYEKNIQKKLEAPDLALALDDIRDVAFRNGEAWSESISQRLMSCKLLLKQGFVTLAEDEHLYASLSMERAEERDISASVEMILDYLIEKKLGLQFTDADGTLVWKLSHGQVLAWKLYSNPYLKKFWDVSDLSFGSEVDIHLFQFDVRDPSPELFPYLVRSSVRWAMQERLGILQPRVGAITGQDREAGSWLTFNLNPKHLGGLEGATESMEFLAWFIPPCIPVAYVPSLANSIALSNF